MPEGTFTGASGDEIHWQSWLPADAKGLVVLAHGVAEHTDRYHQVATDLNEAGYAVFAPDHQGHGRSGGTRGNIGRMAWVVDDLHHLRGLAETTLPGIPVFLLGHSLGGLIALDYLLTHSQRGITGLVLSGAAVDPTVGTALERAAAPLLSALLPNLEVVDLGSDDISRDPEVVRAYQSDPMVHHGKVRARTGAEALAATKRVAAGLPQLTVPALVLHGAEDKLASPAGSRMVEEQIGSTDKTLVIYDGLYHEIFNEPERRQVLDDVTTWLDSHLAS